MTHHSEPAEAVRSAPLLKDGDVVERLKQFRLRWQEDGDLLYLGKALVDAIVEIESLRKAASRGDDWRNDPTADERWNAGCDFAMKQLCDALHVDPQSVSWDAATETVEGDVSSVIWNILRARLGEDWTPSASGGLVREDIAKIVYSAMKWAAERAENGKPPAWVERGNSLAQTEARRFASDIAALAAPAATSGDPVAWVQPGYLSMLQKYGSCSMRAEPIEAMDYIVPIYASPPAPAVESAQVKEALDVAREYVVDGLSAQDQKRRDVEGYPGLMKREQGRLDEVRADLALVDRIRASLATDAEG